MTSPGNYDDLARRIAALEEQVGMEAGLRAGVDRDLGRLSTRVAAIEATVRAVWLTQGEHTARMDEHLTMLLEIRSVMAEHTAMLRRLLGEDGEG